MSKFTLFSRAFLGLPILALLTACGGNLQYQYEESSGLCKDSNGKTGYNKDEVVQCGWVEKTTNESQDLSGQDLRGLNVIDSNFASTDFSNTDLRGASFTKTDLTYSKFDGAKLQGTQFTLDHQDSLYISLKNATVNEQTILGFSNNWKTLSQLSEAGVTFEPSDLANSQLNNPMNTPKLKIDPNYNPLEKQLLAIDLAALAHTHFDHAADNSDIVKVFPEKAESSYIDFFNKRVKAIGYETKFTLTLATNHSFFALEDYFNTLIDRAKLADKVMSALVNYADSTYPKIGDIDLHLEKRIDATLPQALASGRASGLVYIWPLERTLGFSQFQRIAVLMHEARHSDCDHDEATWNDINEAFNSTRRLENEALAQYQEAVANQNADANTVKNLKDKIMLQSMQLKPLGSAAQSKWDAKTYLFKNNRCFHSHSICGADKGSGLAGRYACDDHPWGSYAISAAFAKGALDNCVDCKESQIQTLKMSMADQYARYDGPGEMTPARSHTMDEEQMKDFKFKP